jgi:hypothetical protein
MQIYCQFKKGMRKNYRKVLNLWFELLGSTEFVLGKGLVGGRKPRFSESVQIILQVRGPAQPDS